jgi:nicotinate phosphoribosyltransferase
VRAILDSGGLAPTRIIASGDLDEFRIQDLLAARAPIDAFGVGTSVVASVDAPALGGVYKLVELTEDGVTRGVMKQSPDKATWPGRKQVWRLGEPELAAGDVIALTDDPAVPAATPLLESVMQRGRRLDGPVALDAARDWPARAVASLPEGVRDLDRPAVYAVDLSGGLRDAIAKHQTAAAR